MARLKSELRSMAGNGKGGANYSAAAVIRNAGIGYREPKLVKTVDGLPQLFLHIDSIKVKKRDFR